MSDLDLLRRSQLRQLPSSNSYSNVSSEHDDDRNSIVRWDLTHNQVKTIVKILEKDPNAFQPDAPLLERAVGRLELQSKNGTSFHKEVEWYRLSETAPYRLVFIGGKDKHKKSARIVLPCDGQGFATLARIIAIYLFNNGKWKKGCPFFVPLKSLRDFVSANVKISGQQFIDNVWSSDDYKYFRRWVDQELHRLCSEYPQNIELGQRSLLSHVQGSLAAAQVDEEYIKSRAAEAVTKAIAAAVRPLNRNLLLVQRDKLLQDKRIDTLAELVLARKK